MTKRRQVWLTVFLGMLTAMAPLATDMYLPALPVMQASLQISTSLIQMTLTMCMLGMAVGQIFAGPISDMRGRKAPLVLGLLVFIAATCGCVYAENIWLFLFCRFVSGLAGGSCIVIARAIARDVCEGAELTRFYAVLMMVNGLAPILAPVIGGQILRFTTWRGVFVMLTFIGIILAGASFLFRETLPRTLRAADIGASFRSFPTLLRDRYFRGHCLVQCFVFGAFFSYIGGSSFVFQNIYALSPQGYSLVFGGIGTGLLLAGMLPARLAGRVPDYKMLQYSLLIPFIGSCLLLGGFLLNAPISVIITLLFITIVPLSVMGAASFSLALSRHGQHAGSASALIGFFSMILAGCVMPLVGIAGNHTAIPMVILMITGYSAGTAVYWRMIRPEHTGRKLH